MRAGNAGPCLVWLGVVLLVAPSCRDRDVGKHIDQQVFDEALKQVTTQNLREKAPWFKPYYKQLVGVDDYYVAGCIMAAHGRKYAIRNLEPLLETEKGEQLKRVAVGLYGFSYQLHPQAYSLLRGMDRTDPLVRAALNDFHKARQDEKARQEAGVSKEKWRRLSPGEKWKRVKDAWAANDIKREQVPLPKTPSDP